MNLVELIKVNSYFKRKTNKVKATNALVSFPSNMSRNNGTSKFVPFKISFIKNKLKYKKWTKQSLGVCFEHSSNLLLGLGKNDLYVRAICSYHENANFVHAWNEFEYGGKWFVFDCQDNIIYERQEYYNLVQPKILETYTLEEVLNEYDEFKTQGKKFDVINIPHNLPSAKISEINSNNSSVSSKNYCYSDAKIKLNKAGEVVSAEVSAPEIE